MQRLLQVRNTLVALALALWLAAAPPQISAQDTGDYTAKATEVKDLVIQGRRLEAKGNYQEALPILERALALAPDHVSLYALQLALAPDEWAAPPRPGALRWRQRMAARQDDGLAAAQYQLAELLLDSAGYRHYELSSWARPGFESRHNSAYWERRPYTGIGAGAHSFDGGSRSWNVSELDAYLAAVAAGERPLADREVLDEQTRAFEALALGMRRVEGFSRSGFAAEFGQDPLDRYPVAVEETTRAGLIEVDADAIRLTASGRLLANEALVAFAP